MIDKLDLNSLNITEERKSQLKQIFPEVFTEDKIDFDKLRMALGDEIEESPERYEMNWAGKKESFKQVQIPSKGTLRPCKEESVNFDETENLYIEGDNLEVLKLLQKSYYGKIKMIYIDPPYNTGKDFVYKDNFKDNLQNYLEVTGQVDGEGKRISANQETAGRYHSNWLNMMYPRLFLARNLLKDDGVIFISIDDNEVHNLRKVCDEIFGEENFITQLVWERAYAPVNLKKHFSPNHDHLIVYAKKIEYTDEFLLSRTDEANDRYINPDNDPRGVYKPGDLSVGPAIEKNIYEIITPSGRKVMPPEGYSWRYSKEKFNEQIADNRIYFGANGSNVPAIKRFLSEVKSGITPMTILKYKDVGHTQDARKETKELFNGKAYFDYPKPVLLMKTLLDIVVKDDGIILDFFSGSATTAHAVMQLNAEDEGNRKYIMVQLPETTDEKSEAYKAGYKNICEIGKERIRRAGNKILEELKEKNKQLKLGEETKNINLDTGFKVLKLDTSNFKEWDNTPNNLEQQLFNLKENIKEERTQDDILYEIILKSGLSLSEKIEVKEIQNKKVYSIMNGFLIICLEKDLNLDFIKAIAELKPAKIVCLDIGFKNNDQLKTNAVQIMKSIKFDGENSIEFKTV